MGAQKYLQNYNQTVQKNSSIKDFKKGSMYTRVELFLEYTNAFDEVSTNFLSKDALASFDEHLRNANKYQEWQIAQAAESGDGMPNFAKQKFGSRAVGT